MPLCYAESGPSRRLAGLTKWAKIEIDAPSGKRKGVFFLMGGARPESRDKQDMLAIAGCQREVIDRGWWQTSPRQLAADR